MFTSFTSFRILIFWTVPIRLLVFISSWKESYRKTAKFWLTTIIWKKDWQWILADWKSSRMAMYSDEKSVVGNANMNNINSVLFIALISFHFKCITQSFIVSHLKVLDKLQHTHTHTCKHTRCWCCSITHVTFMLHPQFHCLTMFTPFHFAIVSVLKLYR